MSDPVNPIDVFGKFLMENLRDKAIACCDSLSCERSGVPRLVHLEDDLRSLNDEHLCILKRCIVEAVDVAIHSFLFQVHEYAEQENAVQVCVNGVNVAHLSDGLHGELFGKDGWMAQYSEYGESPEIA